jgi:hypothetical protein
MKLSHHRGVFLHVVIVSLLTFAATRLAISFLLPSVAAQSSCCAKQPPLFPDFLARSWPKGQPVAVKVQSAFGETGMSEIYTGISTWNGLMDTDCSGVSFSQPELADFQLTSPKSDYTIRVLIYDAGSIGAMQVYIGSDGRAGNADMMIAPYYTFSGLRYLGAHETGHSFGMINCDDCPLGTSIMTSYNESQTSPTDCDAQVVGKIYCTCPSGSTYRTCKECKDVGENIFLDVRAPYRLRVVHNPRPARPLRASTAPNRSSPATPTKDGTRSIVCVSAHTQAPSSSTYRATAFASPTPRAA